MGRNHSAARCEQKARHQTTQQAHFHAPLGNRSQRFRALNQTKKWHKTSGLASSFSGPEEALSGIKRPDNFAD
jgi:hypothetical protein